MREIKFRGKIQEKWWYVTPYSDSWQQFWVLVEEETVGQYTGLKDKNGKEIYKGDIVKDNNEEISTHEFPEDWEWLDMMKDSIEVIGNIWENPELL